MAIVIGTSLALFLLAGLLEIGGGYLVWQWWRNGSPALIAAAGAAALVLYGIIPTYQSASFGRVYAAYGGWFVVLSILWGWGGGPHRAGPLRHSRGPGLHHRRQHHHVLAPVVRSPLRSNCARQPGESSGMRGIFRRE